MRLIFSLLTLSCVILWCKGEDVITTGHTAYERTEQEKESVATEKGKADSDGDNQLLLATTLVDNESEDKTELDEAVQNVVLIKGSQGNVSGLLVSSNLAASTPVEGTKFQVCFNNGHCEDIAPASKSQDVWLWALSKPHMVESSDFATLTDADGPLECEANYEALKIKVTKSANDIKCVPECTPGTVITCKQKILGLISKNGRFVAGEEIGPLSDARNSPQGPIRMMDNQESIQESNADIQGKLRSAEESAARAWLPVKGVVLGVLMVSFWQSLLYP